MKILLLPIVLAGVIYGVVWGVRLILWPAEVPRRVSSLRWLIAFGLGCLVLLIEVELGLNPTAVTALNALAVYGIAEALHRVERPDDKNNA